MKALSRLLCLLALAVVCISPAQAQTGDRLAYAVIGSTAPVVSYDDAHILNGLAGQPLVGRASDGVHTLDSGYPALGPAAALRYYIYLPLALRSQ
ncbi:MAG: hypothetical protein JXD18_14850 [Anaerolineae bacterium]|nr:hypothetical protein [Anaerolineae bacterium]